MSSKIHFWILGILIDVLRNIHRRIYIPKKDQTKIDIEYKICKEKTTKRKKEKVLGKVWTLTIGRKTSQTEKKYSAKC